MKKKLLVENRYYISQTDILAIDTLIQYLQYGVLSMLKAKPLQPSNEDSDGLDEYETHLGEVERLADEIASSKTTRFYPNMENKSKLSSKQ
jgi:hypothetical protein